MSNRFDRLTETQPKTSRKEKTPRPKVEPVPVEEPKSFQEKIHDGFYQTKLPYPGMKVPRQDPARVAYAEDSGRLFELFKKDLFEEYGLTGHPKADMAFSIAWDMGHSSGLSEVDIYFAQIAPLLQD